MAWLVKPCLLEFLLDNDRPGLASLVLRHYLPNSNSPDWVKPCITTLLLDTMAWLVKPCLLILLLDSNRPGFLSLVSRQYCLIAIGLAG